MNRIKLEYNFDFEKNLYVLWEGSKSLLGTTIQKFTNCEYNHVANIVGRIGDHIMLSESASKGVDTDPLFMYNNPKYKYIIKKIPLIDARKAINYAISQENEEYGFGQLVTFSYVSAMWNVFGKVVKNPITDGRICSEHTALTLLQGLCPEIIELLDRQDVNCISPKDLLVALDKYETVMFKDFGETVETIGFKAA